MTQSPESTQSSDHRAYYNDGISLVDLAVHLWEYKWLIAGATALSTLVGLAYALTNERSYEYTTTIEIGTRMVDDEPRTIEPPRNVVAKLENTYVPEAIRTYQQELEADNGDQHRLQVNVRNPSDTDLIVLTSEGPEALAQYYIPLHNRVLARLADDHSRETELERVRLQNELELARIMLEELEDEKVLKVDRQRLQNRISEARNKLASLENQEELLRAELENLDVQEDLIRRRLEELEAFVNQARQRRVQTQEEAQTGADGMALMLIDNELQRDIDRQTQLEERVLVSIPENRANLRSQLEDNQRQQMQQREHIAALEGEFEKLLLDQERAVARHSPEVRQLEARLENLRETRAILPPRQSLQAVGVGRSAIVILSVILGGMLGLLAVGIAGLSRSTRERLNHVHQIE